MQSAIPRLFSFSYERQGQTNGWYPRMERHGMVSPEQPQRVDQVRIAEHGDRTVWIEVEMETDASISLARLAEDDREALRDELSGYAARLADKHFREYLRQRYPGGHLMDGVKSEQIRVDFHRY